MPCLVCQNTLKISPCDYPRDEASVTIGIFSKYITSVPYNIIDIPSYVQAYKKLNAYCPCKNCLVKMQCCSSKIDQMCEEYKQVVGLK
jgi:hypothetical protein